MSTPWPSGLEEQRRRPGVVHDGEGALGVRRRDDGRHVLHLEGQGARRLQIDQPRVGSHELGDAGADHRVIISNLDTEARQRLVAEAARGAVDAVDHEQMVAGLEQRQQRGADRRQAGGQGERPPAALEGRHRLLEREGGGRAVAAVEDAGEAVLLGPLHLLDGPIKHRRGVIDGRIDDAVVGSPDGFPHGSAGSPSHSFSCLAFKFSCAAEACSIREACVKAGEPLGGKPWSAGAASARIRASPFDNDNNSAR